ncbi:hypothetical protein [Thorsellia kenyensis]|uniref:Uncharacterized protein n=1 Tax=Thorsellia kenyensis TaxID=1549888 RepID=A0ABV6C9Z6_9GAMM
MSIKEIFGIILLIVIIAAFGYGMFYLGVKIYTKKIASLSDERLIKAYKGSRLLMNIVLSVFFAVVLVFVAKALIAIIFGVVPFATTKVMHKRYAQAIIDRGLELPKV